MKRHFPKEFHIGGAASVLYLLLPGINVLWWFCVCGYLLRKIRRIERLYLKDEVVGFQLHPALLMTLHVVSLVVLFFPRTGGDRLSRILLVMSVEVAVFVSVFAKVNVLCVRKGGPDVAHSTISGRVVVLCTLAVVFVVAAIAGDFANVFKGDFTRGYQAVRLSENEIRVSIEKSINEACPNSVIRGDVLQMDSRLQDVGCDEVNKQALVIEIEATFGIEIPYADTQTLDTIGQMISYVEKKLGQRFGGH
jgi:acyl carrier protein